MQHALLALIFSLFCSIAHADQPIYGSSSVMFCTSDGVTCVSPYKLLVTNGTLTNNGNGTGTLNTGGAGGTPGGSNPQLQYNNAGSFGGITLSGTDGTNIGIGTFNVSGGRLIVAGGNVGIGTTVPNNALDVIGKIKASSGLSFANNGSLANDYYLGSDGSNGFNINLTGYGTIFSVNSNFQYCLGYYCSTTTSPNNIVTINGNGLGGNTAASGSLTDFLINDTMKAGANNDILTAAYINPTFSNGAFTDVKNFGLIVGSGNVGIGTINPGVPLDVNGKIRSTTGGFVFPDATIQTTAATGAASAAGGANAIQLNNGSNVFSAINTFVNLNGNVGVGTSTPSSIIGADRYIDIGKDKTTPGFSMHNKDGSQEALLMDNDDQGAWLRISNSATASNNRIIFATGNTNSSTLDSKRACIPSSGGLIIGTTSCNAETLPNVNGLRLDGNLTVGNTTSILNGVDIGNNYAVAVGNYAGNNGVQANGIATSGNVGVGTWDVTKNALTVNGNIGVGTYIANQVLTVNGKIYSTSGGIQFPDNTVQTTASAGGGSGTVNSGTANQVTYYATTGTAVSGNAGFIFDGTNVGIGTTVPAFKEDLVASDSGTTLTNSSAAMHNITNSDTTVNNFEDLAFSMRNSSAANVVGAKISGVNTVHTAGAESMDMAFLTKNSGVAQEDLRITAGGNIGIGTTIPQGSLAVIGGNVGIGTWIPAGLLEVTKNGIAATATDGLIISNYTASVVGTQKQLSPRVRFIGQGWKSDATAANQQTEWYADNVPLGAATAPGNSLEIVPRRNNVTGVPVYFCQANTGSPKTGIFGLDGGSTAGSTTCISGASYTGFGEINANTIMGVYNNGSPTANISTSGIGLTAGKFFSWFSGTAGSSSTADTSIQRLTTGNIGIGTSGVGTGITSGRLALGNIGIGTTLMGSSALSVMSGNVGIGTWMPGASFEIEGGNLGIGTVSAQSGLTLGGNAHLGSTGTAPTVASNDCGSTTQGTVSAGSTDIRGSVVVGTLTVTSCAVSFNKTFGVAPVCLTQDDTNILGVKNSQTTSKLTITSTTSMSGDTVSWLCVE